MSFGEEILNTWKRKLQKREEKKGNLTALFKELGYEKPRVDEVITSHSHLNPLSLDELWGNFLVEKGIEKGIIEKEKTTAMAYDFVDQKREKPHRMLILANKKKHVYSKLASSPYYCSEITPDFKEDIYRKIAGCYAHVPKETRKGWRERGEELLTQECKTLHEYLKALRKKTMEAIGININEKTFSEISDYGKNVIERFYELYSMNDGIEKFYKNIKDEKIKEIHARNLKEIFKIADFSERGKGEIKRVEENRFEIKVKGKNGKKEREYTLEELLETRGEDILPETSYLSLTAPWVVIVYGDKLHIGGKFFASYTQGLLKEFFENYGKIDSKEAKEIEGISVATTCGCEVFREKAHAPVLYIVYGGERMRKGLEYYFASSPEIEWGYKDFVTRAPKEKALEEIKV